MHLDKLSAFAVLLLFFCNRVGGQRQAEVCGIPLSRGKIIGGVDSGGYRYPWFALLLLKRNSYLPVPVCSGSLISRYHVLTAAHCFTIRSSGQNRDLFSVGLGIYDICSDSEDTREIFNVEDVAVHEKYQRTGKFFDIALIKLARPAGYVFICLPTPAVPDITEVAVVIGFGVTKENDDFVPCHMMEANVTKYSKRDCASSKLPKQDVEEPSVICAGSLQGGVDSCYGDSGGPLQTVTPNGRYVIAGIVSYGYGCATRDVPGVYTNVGSYLTWINSKMSSLGSSESRGSREESVPDSVKTKRKGLRRRPNPGVSFPGQYSSPSTPVKGESAVGGQSPAINDRHHQARKLEKNSGVTFPK